MNNKIEGALQRESEFKVISDQFNRGKAILRDSGIVNLLKNGQENHPGAIVRLSDTVPAFCYKSRRTVFASLSSERWEVRIAVLGENSFGLGKLNDDCTISYIPIEEGNLESTISEAIKNPPIKY